MGKTLKRQRARQLKEQQQQQQDDSNRPTKLPRLAGMPALNAGSSSSKFTFVVSACMQAKNWLGALQTLQAMAAFKKVPKLGAVQRWVREADQAGDEAVTAHLIDAVLRCTMPPGPPAPASTPSTTKPAAAAAAALSAMTAADVLKGSIKRHPPWSPAAAATPAAATPAAATPAAATPAAATPAAATPAADAGKGLARPAAETTAAAASSTTTTAVEQDQQGQSQQQQQQQQHASYATLLYQVPFQPGAGGPAAIHAFPPRTIQLDPHHPPVTAVPVPFVPGAVLLQNVLSDWECEQIRAAAEVIGYSLDVDYTFGGAAGDDGVVAAAAEAGTGPAAAVPDTAAAAAAAAATAAAAEDGGGDGLDDGIATAARVAAVHAANVDSSNTDSAAAPLAATADAAEANRSSEQEEADAAAAAAAKSAARALAAQVAGLPAAAGGPAAGCVWLADDSLLLPVYERVKALLPQQLDGGALAGINARWRLYRYTPGNVYRPHVDGAWPGSGVDPQTGEYLFDAFGDRWSRLTFLVYLNDGFEGGHTTFYTPSAEVQGQLDARGVLPRRGCVLVFPHGGTVGSLVHEGSAVVRGSKYVIRTDVLYMKTDTGRDRQVKEARQQQQQQKSKRLNK